MIEEAMGGTQQPPDEGREDSENPSSLSTESKIPVEDRIMDMDDMIEVSTPADLDNNSHLSYDEAKEVIELVKARASNRKSGNFDVIITLDEWATNPNYGPITEYSRVVLAGKIEDYSEKAYYTEGAYEVLMDGVMDEDEQLFSEMVEMIDERDDGANERGRKFLPKSVVEVVGVVQ